MAPLIVFELAANDSPPRTSMIVMDWFPASFALSSSAVIISAAGVCAWTVIADRVAMIKASNRYFRLFIDSSTQRKKEFSPAKAQRRKALPRIQAVLLCVFAPLREK